MIVDDLGCQIASLGPRMRVVSLVPSLTESIASVFRERLVGATDWCTHPSDLEVVRIRGTKNPNLELIKVLKPDLVVANMEENRQLDVSRLRESGIAVWVTKIVDVPSAFHSLERLFDIALQWPRPSWLAAARTDLQQRPIVASVVVPIWRDPWMVVGGDTFTSDLLGRLGLANAFNQLDRYPHVSISEIESSGADLILLPDEPYFFAEDDGPECFPEVPVSLVSGRLITWYGPSMIDAARLVGSLVGRR